MFAKTSLRIFYLFASCLLISCGDTNTQTRAIESESPALAEQAVGIAFQGTEEEANIDVSDSEASSELQSSK